MDLIINGVAVLLMLLMLTAPITVPIAILWLIWYTIAHAIACAFGKRPVRPPPTPLARRDILRRIGIAVVIMWGVALIGSAMKPKEESYKAIDKAERRMLGK